MEPLSSLVDDVRRTELPRLGESVPRRGNRLTRALFTLLMRLMGWRVIGQLPDRPRFVFVGAPHTSNGDFFLTAFAMAALGIDVHFVMKHTPFVGPVGWFLRWFGGIPLNRGRTHDFVARRSTSSTGATSSCWPTCPRARGAKTTWPRAGAVASTTSPTARACPW